MNINYYNKDLVYALYTTRFMNTRVRSYRMIVLMWYLLEDNLIVNPIKKKN